MGLIPLLRGVEKAWQGAGCCSCFQLLRWLEGGEIWHLVLGMLQPPPSCSPSLVLTPVLGEKTELQPCMKGAWIPELAWRKSQRKSSFCPWEVAFLRCSPPPSAHSQAASPSHPKPGQDEPPLLQAGARIPFPHPLPQTCHPLLTADVTGPCQKPKEGGEMGTEADLMTPSLWGQRPGLAG